MVAPIVSTCIPAILLKSAITVEKLVLVPVWRDAGAVFSTRERAALAWAETVTRVAETGVPDADYEAAAAEFSDKELADLTYAIGLMNVFNRLGVTFRTTPAAAIESLKYHGRERVTHRHGNSCALASPMRHRFGSTF